MCFQKNEILMGFSSICWIVFLVVQSDGRTEIVFHPKMNVLFCQFRTQRGSFSFLRYYITHSSFLLISCSICIFEKAAMNRLTSTLKLVANPMFARSISTSLPDQYFLLFCMKSVFWTMIHCRQVCSRHPWEERTLQSCSLGQCQGNLFLFSFMIVEIPRQGKVLDGRSLCQPSRWCLLRFQVQEQGRDSGVHYQRSLYIDCISLRLSVCRLSEWFGCRLQHSWLVRRSSW